MKPKTQWTILGGLAGGAAFGLVLFLTVGLLGGARPGETGLLFNPAFQSHKVIAVSKEIQPLPWLTTEPGVILVGVLVLAVGHAFIYRSIAPAWPRSTGSQVWRLALVISGAGPHVPRALRSLQPAARAPLSDRGGADLLGRRGKCRGRRRRDRSGTDNARTAGRCAACLNKIWVRHFYRDIMPPSG
jgi:hypothetical protein